MIRIRVDCCVQEILNRIEKKDLAWERYYDLSSQELGELIRFPKMGRTLHKLVHQFPRLELSAAVQPITRTVIKVSKWLITWAHQGPGPLLMRSRLQGVSREPRQPAATESLSCPGTPNTLKRAAATRWGFRSSLCPVLDCIRELHQTQIPCVCVVEGLMRLSSWSLLMPCVMPCIACQSLILPEYQGRWHSMSTRCAMSYLSMYCQKKSRHDQGDNKICPMFSFKPSQVAVICIHNMFRNLFPRFCFALFMSGVFLQYRTQYKRSRLQ